jgi:hypothetical protein
LDKALVRAKIGTVSAELAKIEMAETHNDGGPSRNRKIRKRFLHNNAKKPG